MIFVQDKLVSDAVIEEQFICNLKACKGACCWEGDSGAPLDPQELAILDAIYPKIKHLLTDKGRKVIDTEGCYVQDPEDGTWGTTLVDNGPCTFMTYDDKGVAQCGIEQAYKQGLVDFKKPLSCHLYPIRVVKNEIAGFEALNYDQWDICSAACALGKEHAMPVYKFLKEPLIRAYGIDFYEELEATAQYIHQSKD